MTWSYDPTKLGELDGDGKPTPLALRTQVRLLISDNRADEEHYLQDEEIDYFIVQWYSKMGTTYYVAAVCAETIASLYAREANYSADGVSIGLGNVGDKYRALAVALRAQHHELLIGGGPDVGGITPGEETSSDIEPFDFGTGMHDNRLAGRQNYGSRNGSDVLYNGTFDD